MIYDTLDPDVAARPRAPNASPPAGPTIARHHRSSSSPNGCATAKPRRSNGTTGCSKSCRSESSFARARASPPISPTRRRCSAFRSGVSGNAARKRRISSRRPFDVTRAQRTPVSPSSTAHAGQITMPFAAHHPRRLRSDEGTGAPCIVYAGDRIAVSACAPSPTSAGSDRQSRSPDCRPSRRVAGISSLDIPIVAIG
jgi:hypothetical protein